ncbi:uncharacterized protein LOC108640095 isoform X3 [Manacus vitellinus]|uniref:uncharacterized protein LOC108640095 isoform X3 n=1 Tax=Manacus vitellinus TaxID=328815 RepID=UPI0008468522|nr:uncharacterized protein LOC108640095 isoform X3 [Manacus vitellinus]
MAGQRGGLPLLLPLLLLLLLSLTCLAVLHLALGIEFSFPTTNSTQTSEVTHSTSADLPMPPPVCPTGSSNTSASRLFLSLRLSTPLDLGNSTVQELVLSKLRENLQTAFPCAGLSLEWRGKRSP